MDAPNLYAVLVNFNRLSGILEPNLFGELPGQASVGRTRRSTGIAKLTYLAISSNKLSGTLSPELCQLHNLTGFLIHQQRLSGTVLAQTIP